jgi:hypothetical protein
MGSLTYDRVTVEFDDRILAHLQIVIVQKLRRGESFLLSWRNAAEVGDGRSSAWLHPAIPLYFKFAGGQPPTINPIWLAQLTRSANSSQGLVATGEERSMTDAARGSRPDPAYNVHVAPHSQSTVATESRPAAGAGDSTLV